MYKKEILTCLFSLLHIFISFVCHYGVHSVLEQCIEEIFRVILGWIKETLSKAIIWCNQWSRIDFMPFPSNCIIVFIFSVIWKIYHRPWRWSFKGYSKFIINFIRWQVKIIIVVWRIVWSRDWGWNRGRRWGVRGGWRGWNRTGKGNYRWWQRAWRYCVLSRWLWT